MKIFKRAVALLLALFLMCPTVAFASEEPTISLSSGTLAVGGSFVCAVSIENNPGIYGADLQIVYDDEVMKITTITADYRAIDPSVREYGEFAGVTGNPDNGEIGWADAYGTTYDGVLFWVVFETIGTPLDGKYSVSIQKKTGEDGMFKDSTSAAIPDSDFTIVEGEIEITGGLSASTLTPVIITQPAHAEYIYDPDGVTVEPLSVVCADVEGTLSYQWYTNAGVASNQYGLPIAGATESTYTPKLQDDFLTLYYYCVVTNTYDADHIYSVTSDYAGITYKRCPIPLSMELPVPVKGGEQIVGGYGPAWTSTFRWAPEPKYGVFEADTVYTLTIEVAAHRGYEFIDELPTLTYRGTPEGKLISYELDSESIVMTLVVEYDPTEAAVLESIAVTTPPTKTQYFAGDSFDPTGMVVTGYYDDGTYAEITEYVITPATLTENTTEVTVSCGGKSTTVPVTVIRNSLTSVEITELPDKTVYTVGDIADWAGLEVTATYANGDARILNVGEYTITGFDSSKYDEEQTITVAAGGLTDTFTITVNRVETRVEDFAIDIPMDAVYNGNPWKVIVTPRYDNLDYGTITVKYEGSITAPVNAGVYQITISSPETDTNTTFAETVVGILSIAPAQFAEINMGASSLTIYNGGRAYDLDEWSAVCIDGTPAALSYEFLSGADLVTIDLDARTVKANQNKTGTAEIKFTLYAENHESYVYHVTITVLDLEDVSNDIVFDFVGAFAPMYNGNEFSMADFFSPATYNGSSKGISYEYNGRIYSSLNEIKGVNAGTYTVTAHYSSDSARGSKTLSIVVDKAIAWIYEIPELIYTGQPQTGVADTEFYTVVGGTATDAGTYEATLTLRDPDNYRWNDDYADASRTVEWSIKKAAIDVSGYVWNYHGVFTYDGTEKSIVLENADSKVNVTYSGNTATDAGTYRASATVTVKDEYAKNYEVKGTVVGTAWVIDKAAINVSGYTWNYPGAFTYDGTAKTVTLNGVDSKLDVTYTNCIKTDAGTYTATADLSVKTEYAKNYKVEGTVADLSWTINKADVTVPNTNVSYVYDGSEKTAVAENALYTISGANKGTNAGSYTVELTLKDAGNYKWADDSFTGIIVWHITKAAAQTLTTETSLRYSNTAEQSYTAADILNLLANAGEIEIVKVETAANEVLASDASVKNGAVAYALKSGLTSADKDKTAVITVTFSSTNYKESTVALTVKVMDKVDVSDKITFTDGTAVYNGAKQTHETAKYNGKTSANIRYEYSADPVNVGSYTVTAIYEDADNYGSKSVTFTITQATLTISGAEAADKVYDGTTDAKITGVTFTGMKGSDMVDYKVTAAAFADKNVGENKTVSYTVELTGLTAQNYKLASANGTAKASIIQKKVTVTVERADDQQLVYNGSAQKPDVVISADAAESFLEGKDYSVAYSDNINAGTGVVTVSPVAGSNYTFDVVTLEFSIAKADVTVPNTNVSYVFDGGEKTAVAENALYTISGANKGTNAGSYTVELTLKDAVNYKWADDSFTGIIVWHITKAAAQALTTETSLRYSNTAEQSYTAADILTLLADAGEITITEVSAADNEVLASAAVKNGAVVYSLKNGLTAADKDKTAVITVTFSSTNYKDSTVKLTVKVMDKVDVSDKITFTDGTAEYSGAKQSYETAKYNGKISANIRYEYSADPVNVGSYTVTAIYEDADNYGSKSVTFTITPATLSISGAGAADKVYDGTTAAEIIGVTFTGMKGSDMVDYKVTAAAFADKNVGENKTVSYTVELTGLTAQNYKLASANGTAKADITPKTITVWAKADDTALTYDGTEKKPAVEVGSDDLLDGDVLVKGTDYAVTYSNNVNAGTGAVTVTAVEGSNYAFAAAQDSFTIGKAAAPALAVDGITSFKYTATGEYTLTITGVPTDANGADFAMAGVTDAGNAVNRVTLGDNGQLSVILNGMEEYVEGLTVVITVSVEMGNYETASLDVVLSFKDKDVPSASAQDIIMTYTGEALTNENIKGSADVNGVWEWVTDPADLVNAGTYTAEVKFVPADSDNYAEVIDTITVTVNKADVTGTPDYTEIDEAGKTLADANLSIGTLTPAEGTLVWLDAEGNPVTDPASVEVEDGVRYTWQYTPDNTNYNVKTGTVVLWTSFVIPTIPVAPPAPTYEPVVEETEGGEVVVSPAKPEEGDEVVITPNPDPGKEVDEVIAVDEEGNTVPVIDNGDGTYTYTQPEGVVTVTVTFKCDGTVDCSSVVFGDVNLDQWYHKALDYVVEHGLFKGTSATTFSPGMTMTRGMLITVLHNLENNPQQVFAGLFSDVTDGKYYSVAVEWAAARGIVEGYGNGTFGPNDVLTREQMAVMLWRYSGSPVSEYSFEHYADADQVSTWAKDAMCWAVENGILIGTSEDTLDPKGDANRAQAAQMLMNYLESLEK